MPLLYNGETEAQMCEVFLADPAGPWRQNPWGTESSLNPPRSISLSKHPWTCTERENSSEELRAKTSHCTRNCLV